MKKILYLALLIIVCSCSDTSYMIEGEIENIGNSYVYLYRYDRVKVQFELIDSTHAVNNKFKFQGNQYSPQLAYISTASAANQYHFILNKGEINMNVANGEVNITGSYDNEEYCKYLNKKRVFESKQNSINREYIKLSTDSLLTMTKERELYAKFAKYNDSISKLNDTYIEEHIQSELALYTFYSLSNKLSLSSIKTILGKGGEMYSSSLLLQGLNSYYTKYDSVAVGCKYKDVPLVDKRLSHYITGEKYLVVMVSNALGVPDRKESVQYSELFGEYTGSAVRFISVVVNASEQYNRDVSAMHTVVNTKSNEIISLYGIRSTPTYMIIGIDGTIVARDMSIYTLRNILTRIL